MRPFHCVLIGFLAFVPMASAQSTDPIVHEETLVVTGTASDQLNWLSDAAAELEGRMMPMATASSAAFWHTVRARRLAFRQCLDHLTVELAETPAMALGTAEVQELLNAYFNMVQAIGLTAQPAWLEKELGRTHRVMDQIVEPYGGYSTFKLPDFVTISQVTIDKEPVKGLVQARGGNTRIAVVRP